MTASSKIGKIAEAITELLEAQGINIVNRTAVLTDTHQAVEGIANSQIRLGRVMEFANGEGKK